MQALTTVVQTKNSAQVEISSSDCELKQIESRLAVLLRQDKANWREMAILALQVQSSQLYKQRQLSSFSQWVKEIAQANDRQPSLIWRFLKAAKYFLTQIESSELERVIEAKAPPEALEKLEKIERQAPVPVFQALKERVLTGRATVNECRQIEKDYRPVAEGRTNRGRPPKGQEGSADYLGKWKSNPEETEVHQPQSQVAVLIEGSVQAQEPTIQSQITPQQIAPSIKRSLRADSSWLQRCAEADSPPRNWETHKAVGVDVGAVRRDEQKLLRLGLVAVAQWSLDSKDLFVIEVKTRLADLQVDRKWENYLDYCNYFCFACPQEADLLKATQAMAEKIPSAGILAVDFSSPPQGESLIYPCSIVKFPLRQKGKKTSLVYETLYERIMGWSVTNEL